MKRIHWLIIGIFICALVGVFISSNNGIIAQEEATPTPNYSYIVVEAARVRAAPSETSLSIGTLLKNARLTPYNRDETGNWVLVEYADSFGWVRRDLAVWVENIDALPILTMDNLTPTPVPRTPSPTPRLVTLTPVGSYVIARVNVYVRTGPGLSFTPLGILRPGDVVDPVSIDETGTWVLIRFSFNQRNTDDDTAPTRVVDGFGWVARNVILWTINVSELPILFDNALTPTLTFTPSHTPSPTLVATITETATVTLTSTPTDTSTPTITPSSTATHTDVPTETASPTATNTETATATATHTDVPTETASPTATNTETATATATHTDVPTEIASPTATNTETATATATHTDVPTETASPTATNTETATATATHTDVPTETASPTATNTETATATATHTDVPTETASPTATNTETATATHTDVPTETASPTATNTETATATHTDVPTETASPTATNTETATATHTDVPTETASPTATNTETATATHTDVPTEIVTIEATVDMPLVVNTETPVQMALLPSETPTLSGQATPINETQPPAIVGTEVIGLLLASETPTLPNIVGAEVQTQLALEMTRQITTSTPEASEEITPESVVAQNPTESPIVPTVIISPDASETSPPLEAILAGIALSIILTYVFLVWRGQSAVDRYAKGFVIKKCPVCRVGNLEVETRTARIWGIPRPRRTIRCDNCRSLLRETGTKRWRYAVDKLANITMYDRYNGLEVDERALQKLAQNPIQED